MWRLACVWSPRKCSAKPVILSPTGAASGSVDFAAAREKVSASVTACRASPLFIRSTDIPTRGTRPVQGRTHVVDLLAIGGHPFGHGPRPQLCVALFEQSPEVLRMAPGEGCQLATLTELLAGVGARRLEQAVLHGELAGMGRHERPGDQARDAV